MARIAICDDSMFQRKIIMDIIKDGGHQCLEFSRGRDLIKSITESEKEHVDGVILDLLMPDMMGTEILKSLRDRGILVPIAILSADIQESKKKETYDLGANVFFNKPVKKEDLIEFLDTLKT